MTILAEIYAHTREEVAGRKRIVSLAAARACAEDARPPLDFVAALRAGHPRPGLIAEVKHASPSRGLLAPDFDPLRLARLYGENGAAAISVLTDERYFGGSLDHLSQIAACGPRLPLLRKDFIGDPYQVYEARAAGASAVLLIAALLTPAALRALAALAEELGMAALVEVHDEAELGVALDCNARLVGINNRNLADFTVDLGTAVRLRPQIPAGVCVVAESGIHTPADVARLTQACVDAILVGEALVTAPDVAAAVRDLAGLEAPQSSIGARHAE
jgi:indole-3-glycerol phosphate synthase